MNDLTLIHAPGVPPGNLSVAEITSAIYYGQNATAESTRSAYNCDMAVFRHWCAARDACALPAAPAIAAAYLAHLADSGRKASGIGRAAAGIAYHHRMAGIDPSPTAHAAVRDVMKGVRRKLGVAPVKKHVATADIVGKMLAHCDDSLIGKRDRALIAVGMAGAFRRSELIALTTEDVTEVKDGLLITIRRSKTDQEGAGQVVSLPHGHHIRPVEALAAYMAAAERSSGIIFRSVKLGGKLGGAMHGNSCARVVKKLIARAGLDPTVFSAHNLRSGFLSSAAEHKADVFAMQRQSRHRSIDVLSDCVQSKNLFHGHAGSGFL